MDATQDDPEGATQPDGQEAATQAEPEQELSLAIVAAPVASHVPQPLEAMTWQELDSYKSSQAYCHYCKKIVDTKTEKVIRKKSHKSVCCQACHNICTMLYKNFDMQALGWQSLGSEELASFFQSARMCKDASGKFKLDKIKGSLTETLTTIQRTRTSKRSGGSFLPLSVYAKMGYDTKPIEEKGEWMSSTMPLTCNPGL